MKKELPIGAKFAIPLLFLIIGFNIPMFLRFFIDTANTSILSTTVKIVFLSLVMFLLIPRVIGIPSKENSENNLFTIGLINRNVSWKSIVLGLLLGLISLSFMLLGSAITGGYTFDIGRLEFTHVYFSIVPGVFEEVVFRGFLMVVAVSYFKNIKKAAVFQIIIFTLSHMKDFSGWGIVDTITVGIIAIAFTYVVFKTGHLYTAIIFHFIHDAFIFVVQKANGLESFVDHLAFYAFVWLGMLIIIIVTKFSVEKLNIRGPLIYNPEE